MQLRKFYGRSLAGTLSRVRQALGPDAFILETHEVEPGSAAARVNPGARYEIIAAREVPAPVLGRAMTETPSYLKTVLPSHKRESASVPSTKPARSYSLLADLGELKSQLRELLDGAMPAEPGRTGEIDLADYHALIEMGIRHDVLAPHFRAWLQWRTASAQVRKYLFAQGGPAARMQANSLREWMLHAWAAGPSADLFTNFGSAAAIGIAPRIVGLVGPSGAGKTTTLAKMVSNNRRDKRQKSAVVTLDTHRFGAVDQWRKVGRLMDLEIMEISEASQIQSSVRKMSEFDWVGIDTPGQLEPGSEAAAIYGSLLAECPDMKTVLVLPATQQEPLSRLYMRTMGQTMRANQIIFTKLDEAHRAGLSAGSVVNLSLGERWPVAALSAGTRVPEDLAPATPENLWTHVLAPAQGALPVAGGVQ